VAKAFSLAISYASVIGGFGTLIGSNSNIVMKEFYDEFRPNSSLNFFTFMLFALPISIILLFVSWLALCIMWFPKK
jgi:sodium-dependent dicarboxylate transporter 2/3/5